MLSGDNQISNIVFSRQVSFEMFSLKNCQQGGACEQQQAGGHIGSGIVGEAIEFSNKGVTQVVLATAGATGRYICTLECWQKMRDCDSIYTSKTHLFSFCNSIQL